MEKDTNVVTLDYWFTGKKGAQGEYFQIDNKTGVKVLKWDYPLSTIEELKSSRVWHKAEIEAAVLKHLEDSDITPKCYGVVPVRFKVGDQYDAYYTGILMEHIEGIQVEELIDEYEELDEIMESVQEKLMRHNYVHPDLHPGNILMNRDGKVYAIDFGHAVYEEEFYEGE